ncbi:methyltransferase type 11, partial [Elstera litoralis]
IENSINTFNQQNQCREVFDLPPRQHADYNLFFDEATIFSPLPGAGLELVETEDFISLHDLLLYVLVPAINGGTVDYDHPIVKAAATLNRGISAVKPSAFGHFGQNRLYCCRKLG